MPADGSVDGVTTVNTAISSPSNKRKRITKNDDEIPKAKRGAKAKEAKAKAIPKEATRIEDGHENLDNQESADFNGEIDQTNNEVDKNSDEEDGIDV